MDEPMNYALVNDDGVVTNVIWLCASNRGDFANSVCVANHPVAIGAAELSGGVVIPSQARTLVQTKSASFTIGADDLEKTTLANSASAILITLPADATYDAPVGSAVNIIRWGAGAVSFALGSGASWKAVNGTTAISAQNSAALAIKTAANTWWLSCG